MHDLPLWASSDFAAPLARGPGDGESPTGQTFGIDVERRSDDTVVAHVLGPIDLLTTPAVRKCVEDHIDAEGGLVLNLSHVDFLAASGLTALTDADRRAMRDNRAWGLVANTRPVLRPLEVLGLVGVLPAYHTVQDAVAAVRAAAVTG